jgi:transcriptional regulator with XRE-family HTH domain
VTPIKGHDQLGRFAKNLTEVMGTLGMNGADLARRTGLTPAAISLIMSGKREPTFSTILKILEVIPVKFERLIA